MHAVGDRVDLVLAEHLARDLAVPLGHAVDVMAVVEREVGHVQHVVEAELDRAPVVGAVVVGEHAPHQRQRKLVVARGHRRVRGEHAKRLDRHGHLAGHFQEPAPQHLLVAEFEQQQRRMPLVHVEAPDALVAQRAQHAHAADAEDDFLAQPIAIVAAVQVVGEPPVGLGVLGEVAVEQQHRQRHAAGAAHVVAPGAQRDLATLDAHLRARRHLGEHRLRRPRLRLLGLPALGIEALAEVALAMHQRDRHHRHVAVGRRAHRVAGEHAEAAAVGRHRLVEADFHREVGDRGGVGHVGLVLMRAVASRGRGGRSAWAGKAVGGLRAVKSDP